MVELSPEDYSNIVRWFEFKFARVTRMEDVPLSDKRTFWKLTFLAEDKIEEIKQDNEGMEK